ncbi:glycosyltransferase family 2 protein [Ignisphaera sp. 4213-co]|uniref:Glycosyltransferase family 2 protein n=1 Tax=Ignisphaera cupida TaxID=3050454 RepID=A0ABD4Z8K5_9CREN|nr:glycosyltransferase family 2 protein [Ignisphaera sp. 4213-co]MDK6029263.1 glycosyltransferase family 2 protein [Ignisphaera sp. 4213-co]
MLLTISLALIVLPLLFISLYHAFLLRGVGVARHSDIVEGDRVFLSIITPIKNEPRDVVENYSKHFMRLFNDFGNVFECIVVADYTNNEMFFDVLNSIVLWDGIFIVRRFNGFGGRNGAINDGARFSLGENISVIDVDGYPNHDVLKSMMRCRDVCVSWWRVCDKGLTRISRTIAFLTEYGSWLYYKNKFLKNLFIYPLGSGVTIRKEILSSIGLYRVDVIQDDLWLGTQLLYRGIKPRLIEPMCVGAPKTIEAYLIQQRRWAYGATDILKRFGLYVIKSPANTVVKLEALFYLLQPIIAILPGIGFILAGISPLFESPRPCSVTDAVLITAFFASLAIESINIAKFHREFTDYDKPYVSGRASALSAITSISIIPYVIASLIGIRIPYRVTPKSSEKTKDLTVTIIAMLFAVLLAIAIFRKSIVSATLSLMILTASVYAMIRLS